MATVELYLTGDQIGTYDSVSMSGNSNGVKVTLDGVEPLGDATDVYRIVVTQVNDGDELFTNGQFVAIYAYPDDDPDPEPLYEYLNPQHDQFQGRASSAEHQIFTSPDNLVIDINGVTEGTMQYGPGINPPRSEQLAFESLLPDPPSIPCFVAGTLIETETGPLPVECLSVGDRVRTLDHGAQPIRWIGRRRVAGLGNLAPVAVAAGALGNHRRLVVSPQHRLLLSDWRAEMFFGQPQVLVAAKHLVNGTTIRQVPRKRVTYLHFAFDAHEVVFAEGIPTESLHLGEMALAALDRAAREELTAIFPELAGVEAAPGATARTCLRGWEGQLLAQESATGVLSPAA